MIVYYNRRGERITEAEYERLLLEEEDYRRIARHDDGTVLISTVWLGYDFGIDSSRPLIFETMVFGGPDDDRQERYSTEVEARAGHARWVARSSSSSKKGKK